MDEIETHLIGQHRIALHFRDDVGPASPYSLLLAESIPDLTGKTVVDLGTGSGILAIVASLADGRSMIDALVREAPMKLNPSGHVLMTHTSLANLRKTLDMLKSNGLQARILAERAIAFRPFIDRAWLDKLGGEAEGLYSVRDDIPYETLSVVDAIA